MPLIPYPTGANVLWENAANMPDLYCVYDVTLCDLAGGPDTIIFIGTCKLLEVFAQTDARRNSEWRKMVTAAHTIGVRILATGTRPECANERGRMIMNMVPRPYCNQHGIDTIGNSTIITCNETGISYDSQTDAAAKLGIRQSALSNHLNGRPSYNAVKGMTFRRGR